MLGSNSFKFCSLYNLYYDFTLNTDSNEKKKKKSVEVQHADVASVIYIYLYSAIHDL